MGAVTSLPQLNAFKRVGLVCTTFFAPVQSVDFLSVKEAKTHSLTDVSSLVFGFNGGCSHVLAKCQPAIVHHAVVIIRFAKAGAHIPRILFEVMLMFIEDICPLNVDELVPVRSGVLVEKSQRVHNFMDNCSNAHAAKTNGDHLLAAFGFASNS